MSADLNEIRPDPKKWEDFQIAPKATREALSRENDIKIEVLDEISDFISQYKKLLHDSIQHFRSHCTITIDGESLEMTISDQATLSVIHHNHTKDHLRLTDQKINLNAKQKLGISGALVEPWLRRLIETLEAKRMLIPYEEAISILSPKKRPGNRPHDPTALRHTIIREAARILKRNGHERSYAKKLANILPHFGFREFNQNNIRRIVNA